MDNQVILHQQTADSQSFSLALQNLTSSLMNAARTNVEQATEGSEYTDLELRSMVMIEALRLTNGMDLATILTRGEIITNIETEGLTSVHPNQYTDLTHMAHEQGISISELSDTKALCQTIFPYVTNTLNISLAELWTSVGKAAFREMVPALRSIITGVDASHTSVRTAVRNMLDQAAAQLITEGGLPEDIEERAQAIRATAVQTLLVNGATLPTSGLRRLIRPSRTPAVEMVTLDVAEGQWYAVIQIESQEQLDMLTRVLGTHANNTILNARNEDTQRQVRTLRSFFPGE